MPRPVDAWDRQYLAHGRVFKTPHPDMAGFVRLLKEGVASRVLDLGCGSGRHVVYLAQEGLSVHGLDVSPTGLELTQQWLFSLGLDAELCQGNITEALPYPDSFFDSVVSVQVIHHARLPIIEKIIDEMTRLLRPEGFIFITVPKRRHRDQNYSEIEPNTYLPLDGPEKGLPHHLFSAESLAESFRAYDILDIHLDSTDHYCLTARKR